MIHIDGDSSIPLVFIISSAEKVGALLISAKPQKISGCEQNVPSSS
jgi:hypothetical protein